MDARACHCSICRKAFNGSGSAVCWLEPGSFRWITGEEMLSTYVNEQEFGLNFCSRCGSTLGGVFDGNVIFVTLGTLDGNPDVKIGEHIFVGSKARWDDIGGDAPKFEGHSDATEG